MFLGVDFSGTDTAVSSSAVNEATISRFQITHAVLDELYATKNVLLHFDWNIPDTWDFHTYLHAHYRGNTFAGNVEFSESLVEKVKIKKRFKGDFVWKTIYEKEIRSNDDFSVELWDYYEPSDTDIEYAYVAVIAGADVDSVSAQVHSEFDCYFICDKNISHPIPFDTENTITYNHQSQIIVSPGRKYPYVVSNGISGYYSGTMNTTFIECKNGTLDVEHSWEYRNQIDRWLSNGEAKILKSFQGDMWMIHIINNIPRTNHEHDQYVSQQFDWVECGDPAMIADLYDHGFIDTDTDRE